MMKVHGRNARNDTGKAALCEGDARKQTKRETAKEMHYISIQYYT